MKRSLEFLVNFLCLAGGATVFILVLSYPWTIASTPNGWRQTLFALMVISASLGFARGLGFRAQSGWLRILLSAPLVLALLALALGWITYALSIGYDNLAWYWPAAIGLAQAA